MSAGPGNDVGLVHLGLFYDTPEDLVGEALPLVRAALESGDAVATVVDRRTARALREALGSEAAVDFRSPAETLGRGSDAFARALRAWVRENRPRRTFVLGQYPMSDSAEAGAFREEAIDLVLGDLPLTVLCGCAVGADSHVVDTARRGHRRVLGEGSARANLDHRPPPDRSFVPAAAWGPRTLRMSFRDSADLGRVRERVARVAGDVGLRGDEADAAVLAVHEAALLACRPIEGPGPGGECVLELRATGSSMLAEVQGPPLGSVGPPTGADEDHPDRAADDPAAAADPQGPLRYLRLFCREASVREGLDHRSIRVLTEVRRAGNGTSARVG